MRDTEDRELLSPSELLSVIVEYATTVGLMQALPAEQDFYRARFQAPGEKLSEPHQLGPPPPDKAAQNRMSPAGIVMMYVSEDVTTALNEAATRAGAYAVAKFRTRRGITILDLADLPPITSLFAELPDTLEYDPRKMLLFLHHVARDISRPIVRDDRVHIEYVPTQVVTEYVRNTTMQDATKIDGIRYRSSRRRGGMSLVLFAGDENVVGAWTKDFPKGESDEWLELVRPVTEIFLNQEDLESINAPKQT